MKKFKAKGYICPSEWKLVLNTDLGINSIDLLVDDIEVFSIFKDDIPEFRKFIKALKKGLKRLES